jgi:hypothetical protein
MSAKVRPESAKWPELVLASRSSKILKLLGTKYEKMKKKMKIN